MRQYTTMVYKPTYKQRAKYNQENYQRHKFERKLKYLKNRYGVIFEIAEFEIPTDITDDFILEIKQQIRRYLI